MPRHPGLQNRLVRDLWWAVMSPGLADSGFCAVVPPFDPAELHDSFAKLDAAPEPLEEAVAGTLGQERLRLGAYFEELVRFFVRNMAGHEELQSGTVISEKKRTVGELDLLFRDGAQCHHWELAVKFFLHVPDLVPDPGQCFVGPQTRDRLHRKLARVRDHQLPLAKHPAAAQRLKPWQPLRSAALLRGRLFYPVLTDWDAARLSPATAADHPRGWWCSVDQCEERLPHADAYALLSRREWLSPVHAAYDPITRVTRGDVCAWARDAALTWPAGVARSYVVAGLDPDGRELHRGFLVSVGWPGRGSAH